MASLKGSRTDHNPRQTFSDAGRFDRLPPSGTRQAIVALRRTAAAQGRVTIDRDGGHLDFLAAGYDTSSSSGNPLGSTVARMASAIAVMTDDHIAMHAEVARTAHDEGTADCEGIADWFETVAIAGRPHAGEMRRALDNMR